MNFFENIYIKTIKCFIIPCEKASLLMTKNEFEKLGFKELVSMRMHLMKCKYCRWLLDEERLISTSIKNNKFQIENDHYFINLSDEQRDKIKKKISE